MPRRRFVVIVSAAVLLTLGVLAGVAFFSITQTDYGRDYVRRLLIAKLQPGVKGKLYIGKLGGGLLRGVTVDSLEIRDDEDSLFVATGPLFVQLDARDLLDRRVLVRRVEVERPVVRIRQYENNEWNYRRIFPKGKPRPPRTEPGFGDFIVIDTATVHDATLTLIMPWHPADSLKGARRDSAVAFNVLNVPGNQCGKLPLACLNEIRRTWERGAPEGVQTFGKVWRWTRAEYASTYVRIADPDSAGRYFDIRRLNAEESTPPLPLRDVAGGVLLRGDSAWINVTRFRLSEGSRGSAGGKVVWGSGLPARYALRVVGDTVSLADFSQRFDSVRSMVVRADSSWLYPTLPSEGGGRLVLDIRSDRRDPHVIDYIVSKMDVRTTAGSRMTGGLTFSVGGPVLAVKDVNAEADPVDFRLLRQFNGQPFPYPWAGKITGTVRASGGPLNRFKIESSNFVFRDANVAGATTVGTARGELDILRPAFTAFRGFDVDVDQLDLRTLQFLNPNFPRVRGYVAGAARLDSSWLDVRFTNADLRHFDGPGEPSHATGSGRVTWGEQFLTYDMSLETLPINFSTLARSYEMLPLRGSYRGPMRVKGTIEDLDLRTELTGPGGVMAVDGHFDLYPPGFAARLTGRVAGLDLRTLLDGAKVSGAPTSNITADVTANLAGDSLDNLAGSIVMHVDRSMVDGVRVHGAQANLEAAEGRLRVDTLVVESSAGSVTASGGVGLVAGRTDSLGFQLTVDSLGGLRRYIRGARRGVGIGEGPNEAATAVREGGIADSLTGSLGLIGSVSGSIDSLVLSGKLAGSGLFVGGTQAKVVDGAFAITDVGGEPRGTAAFNLDTLVAAGVRLRHAGAELQIEDARHAGFRVVVASQTGERLESLGRWRLEEHAHGAPLPTSGSSPSGSLSSGSSPSGGDGATNGGGLLLAARPARDGLGRADGAVGPAPARDVVERHHVVELDSLTLALDSTSAYALTRHPARITLHEAGVQIDSLELRHAVRGWMRVDGGISDTGSVDLTVAADSLSLGDLTRLAQTSSPVGGQLSVDARVTGTRDRPLIALTGALDSVAFGSTRLERLLARASYDSTRMNASLDLLRGGRRALTAEVSLPVNLSLRPVAERLLPNDSLRGSVHTDSVGLAVIEAFSDQVSDTRGSLEANLDLGGTWRRPVLSGHLGVSGGEMSLANAGIRLRDLAVDAALTGDSLAIRRVVARSSGRERSLAGDTLSLTGFVSFKGVKDLDDLDPLRMSLQLYARNTVLIDKARVATLAVTTTSPLTLTGPYNGAVLRGAVRIENGVIAIPELVKKQVIDPSDPELYTVVDTSLYVNRTLLSKYSRNPDVDQFVRYLSAENVTVTIGDNVWLRSAEANIKLGGTLNVRRGGSTREDIAPQLALDGALETVRGTYRLDLVAVQPVFDVEQGTLRFFGDPDLNPTLDISAVHTVRQPRTAAAANRPDVRVRVRIEGTLAQPTLSLSSADEPPIPTSDLLSYLITGEPSLQLGETSSYGGEFTSILLRTGSSILSSFAESRLGFFDVIQLQAAGSDAEGRGNLTFEQLTSTRLGVGKQIGDRTFVSLNTGLCPLLGSGSGQAGSENFLSVDYIRGQLGGKIEHRFNHGFFAELGIEPGASSQTCTRSGVQTRLLNPTPSQVGFDLFRQWSF